VVNNVGNIPLILIKLTSHINSNLTMIKISTNSNVWESCSTNLLCSTSFLKDWKK